MLPFKIEMCKVLYFFSCVFLFFLNNVNCDTNQDVWIEPNAWGREYHGLRSTNENQYDTCSKCQANALENIQVDNDLAFGFYKKLIAILFNRHKLQYDESKDVYKRSIHFVLTPAQLRNLNTLKDSRDLDGVLSEIWENSRILNVNESGIYKEVNLSITGLFSDIFKDTMLLLKTYEVQLVLKLTLAIVCLIYLKQRFNLSTKRIIITFVILPFVIGFVMSYIECNKRLEIENMIEVIERKLSWWETLFGTSDKYATLRKSAKVNLPFCRPDHVILAYFNEMFVNQLQSLLEEFIKSIATLKGRLPWYYFMFAVPCFAGLTAFVIWLSFKYILSPMAWIPLAQVFKSNSNHPQKGQALPQLEKLDQILAEIGKDRISGENLTLVLNTFSKPSIDRNVTQGIGISSSGVEDVVEKLLPPQDTQPTALQIKCDDNDSSSTSSSTTPNNSFEIITNDLRPKNVMDCDSKMAECTLPVSEVKANS